MRLLLFTFCFFFSSNSFAFNENIYSFSSTSDAKRFETLTKETRCVVCQNQSIADSNAPLANDLRGKIYQLIVEKKSNQEIQQYLVKRYGEFILLRPQLNKFTILLWAFPFMAIAFVFFFILKWR